jgi:hypothetical protein
MGLVGDAVDVPRAQTFLNCNAGANHRMT